MFRIETREREDLDDWYPVIDMAKSRSKSVVRVFMNDKEVNGYVKTAKLKEELYRVIDLETEE